MKLVIAYAGIALLTFGYSASSTDVCRAGLFRGPMQVAECRFMMGMGSALTWPLYWTWTAFDAGLAALQEQKQEGGR